MGKITGSRWTEQEKERRCKEIECRREGKKRKMWRREGKGGKHKKGRAIRK